MGISCSMYKSQIGGPLVFKDLVSQLHRTSVNGSLSGVSDVSEVMTVRGRRTLQIALR